MENRRICKRSSSAWTVDLRSYLKNPHTSRVLTLEKVQIAIDIAEALAYAHSLWSPVVHRDLKSRNVLLSEDMKAKLSDVGVSQHQSGDNCASAMMIEGFESARWLALYVVASKSPDDSPVTDVFSFGAMLCELDTHALLYDDVIRGDKFTEAALLERIATGELKPSLSVSCLERIVELVTECFAFNLVYRPSAIEVTYSLRTIVLAT